MQPDTLHDPVTAGGTEVVLPSAASSGGFVQVRTAPAPRNGFDCGLGGNPDAPELFAAATHPEALHAR